MKTKAKNPFLEEYLDIKKARNRNSFFDEFSKRRELINKYSFAIPDDFAIQKLVEYSPVIEIGSGIGYWAHLVNNSGGKVLCYDDDSWELSKKQKTYTKIYPMSELNKDDFSVSSLFICWPPMDEMAEIYLQMYLENNGKTLIYVGEFGGCTGNDKFFELIQDNFELELRHEIPRWKCINDRFYIYTRV